MVLATVLLVLYLGGLAQYYLTAAIGSEARMNRLGIGDPILVWFGLDLALLIPLSQEHFHRPTPTTSATPM